MCIAGWLIFVCTKPHGGSGLDWFLEISIWLILSVFYIVFVQDEVVFAITVTKSIFILPAVHVMVGHGR